MLDINIGRSASPQKDNAFQGRGQRVQCCIGHRAVAVDRNLCPVQSRDQVVIPKDLTPLIDIHPLHQTWKGLLESF